METKKKQNKLEICLLQDIHSHPYLYLLYSSLEKLGCKIKCFKTKQLYRLFIRILINNSCKLLHLHWIESLFRAFSWKKTLLRSILLTLFLLLTKYVFKKRIIITIHNLFPHERLFPYLENWVFYTVLMISDAIIAHNNYTKLFLIKYYKQKPQKIKVIPHGNFIEYYPSNISREEARKTLNIPRDKIVLLFLGAIRKYKGLEEALPVLEEILSKYEQFYVMICGKPYDEELADRIRGFCNKYPDKCFIRLEYIPDEEIQLFMKASDVGIIPYSRVTTSGSALLFLSFGKPVIVPKLPPIVEQVGDAGIYYRPGDKESLKRAILELVNIDLESLSKKAYRKALEYDWNIIARETLKLYISIL